MTEHNNSFKALNAYETRAYERFQSSFGPLIRNALIDDDITEIMLNPDGSLFAEFKGGGLVKLGTLPSGDAEAVVRTIASVANRELKSLSPIFSGEVPGNGARFEALLPPLVRAPIFSIRKHSVSFISLEQLAQGGMLCDKSFAYLHEAVAQKRTIVVSGGTGTGKTTLVKALINELGAVSPKERVLTIEDTPEIKIDLENTVQLYTSDGADMAVLLRSALRLRPDRIVVGEVRGAEALDLVDALSTGHSGGLCTVHAGSISQALKRLTLLISRHPNAPRLIEPTLAEAMDVIVQLKRGASRKVAVIGEVKGFAKDTFLIRQVFVDESLNPDAD